uniref:Uncharacterized protein n=1 Tax=Cucumis melo TaxID=3656 RepID=A0A9I9EJB6_CUCME
MTENVGDTIVVVCVRTTENDKCPFERTAENGKNPL